MVKSISLLIVASTLTFNLTGCVKKHGVKKTSSQTCAPIYKNQGRTKSSNCNDNTSSKNTVAPKTDAEKNKKTTNRSNNFVQTGRYTVIKAMPTQAQSNLLDVMITVTIPSSIKTIDDTVRYLLKRSGYYMSSIPAQNQQIIQILSKPLPEIHRKIGPMRLIDALSMLTTPAFELITDPVKREIKYQLKESYKYNPGVQS
jgi:type IV pili sensor histidine kinase/response regulator